jgi:hypothetical protein
MDIHQAFSHQPKAADREVSRGHVQRSAFMFCQQAFQDISENVGLVIDDVGEF